ncbi:MAG: DUF971 domain-containing protein [Rhodospirillaceae bacterium]
MPAFEERCVSDPAGSRHWPTELCLKRAERVLEIAFEDGARFALPAELLRVESPSAEVQGHGPGQKTLVSGKRAVGITAVEPVGNYAVRLVFDDGHDSGLYSWSLLHELGERREARWSAYLAALGTAGMSRDP